MASVIGGHLGLAGTVVGAFILSVVSGIALPLFRTSLEKSHEQIKRVVPRRTTDAARTVSPQRAPDTSRKAARGPKVWMTVGGTVAIFVTGVGSILGIQAVTGTALSPGTSALQSGVSQVVKHVTDGTGTTPTDPKPDAPTVEPSTVPMDPVTDPTEQPTGTPAPTSEPAPSAEPTAPADEDTPVVPEAPEPAAGLSDGSGGAGGAGSQAQPGVGDTPAK